MTISISGHEFQREVLRRAAAENVVSHAYLFSGPDGIGKRLVALEFAGILNCTSSGKMPSGCACGSCRKVEKGIHPDVVTVEFAGVKNIKVDQVREEIEEKLYLKPFEGRFKVVIVDEAEKLNNSAQNAFLKTLEEPPPASIIILVTSRPGVLLPTIRSRCQPLNFSALPERYIAGVLTEKAGLSPDEAGLYARVSSGSLGAALRLDAETMEWRRELLSALGGMSAGSASGIISLAEELSESASGEPGRLDLAFRFISLWLRDLALLKIGSDEISNVDMKSGLADLAESLDIPSLMERQRQVEKTWYDIVRANANARLSLENLFIKLARRPGSGAGISGNPGRYAANIGDGT